MKASRHFVETVITQKGWQPYIACHWINFGSQKSGVIITFRDHTSVKYSCSNKVAAEILALAK